MDQFLVVTRSEALVLKPYEDLLAPYLAFPHLCSLSFASAGAVVEPDVPAMPAAYYFTGLHDAFAERESKVGTKILDGVNAIIPAKEGDIQAIGFHRVPESFTWNL
jgi:hypothetical protein